MIFHKNGKHTYFSENKQYIINRTFDKEWSIYKITAIPGKYEYICTYHYLKDAKREINRRCKQ